LEFIGVAENISGGNAFQKTSAFAVPIGLGYFFDEIF
jgi:hypothetical protein